MPKHKPELASIYNVFGLSSNHELSTLLVNIENTKRFADLLHCSGLMKPDTHLGENARHIEVSDDQATSCLFR